MEGWNIGTGAKRNLTKSVLPTCRQTGKKNVRWNPIIAFGELASSVPLFQYSNTKSKVCNKLQYCVL